MIPGPKRMDSISKQEAIHTPLTPSTDSDPPAGTWSAQTSTAQTHQLHSPQPPHESTYQPLQALNILATRLVVEDVRDVVAEDLLASRPLVNSDHRDSDRPGRVADREAEVGVVRAEVFAHLHIVRDLGDRLEDVGCEILWRRGENGKYVEGSGRTRLRRDLKRGFRYSAEVCWVAEAILPCVLRLMFSARTRAFRKRSEVRAAQRRTWSLGQRLLPLLEDLLLVRSQISLASTQEHRGGERTFSAW